MALHLLQSYHFSLQGMHLCIGIIQFLCLFNGFCPQFVWVCFSRVRSKVFRLLSKLKCFTAFFCGCKNALNVLSIVGLMHISPYCSLFVPARVIVLATKITRVLLKMKKIVNNHCTCCWAISVFKQNCISECHFLKSICITFCPSMPDMVLKKLYHASNA